MVDWIAVSNVPINTPGHDELHNDEIKPAIAQLQAQVQDLIDNGVGSANLDTSAVTTGTFDIARLSPGSVLTVDKVKNSGSWPGSRPSARTDITYQFSGDTDPAAIAINGDFWDQT